MIWKENSNSFRETKRLDWLGTARRNLHTWHSSFYWTFGEIHEFCKSHLVFLQIFHIKLKSVCLFYCSLAEIELKKYLGLRFWILTWRYFAKFLDPYPRTKIRCDPLERISSLVLLFRARNCDAWHNGFKIILMEHLKQNGRYVFRSKAWGFKIALKVPKKIAPKNCSHFFQF